MDFARQDDEWLLATRSPELAGPAFEEFYERHERLIVAFHLRRTGDPELAADLTAETFARALLGRERFSPHGPHAGVRWLYGIAGNVLRSNWRKTNAELHAVRRLQLDRPDLGDAELEAIDQAGEVGAVLEALAGLPEAQREAIRALVLDEHSYDDIAARSGVAPAAVRKRVSRGLATLRRALEETR